MGFEDFSKRYEDHLRGLNLLLEKNPRFGHFFHWELLSAAEEEQREVVQSLESYESLTDWEKEAFREVTQSITDTDSCDEALESLSNIEDAIGGVEDTGPSTPYDSLAEVFDRTVSRAFSSFAENMYYYQNLS